MIAKMDIEQYTALPTEDTIAKYPTLMDIVEAIAVDEENKLMPVSPLAGTYMPDWLYCMTVVGHSMLMKYKGMPVLMPTAKRYDLYYRGESKYYDKCLPSLWRTEDKIQREKDTDLSYLQTAEMMTIMSQHPVIRFMSTTPIRLSLSQGRMIEIIIPIQYDALAQHYGIKTRYLDLTTDKWAAAFFAATDYKDGEYFVHRVKPDDEFKIKFGAFYIIQLPDDIEMLTKNNILPIGQQYFNRPGSQSGLVMDMSKYKDLNKCSIAKKIYFRHDNQVSEQIYHLCQQGKRFFPYDSLQKVVDKIVKDSKKEFSKRALDLFHAIYYPTATNKEISEKLKNIGATIVNQSSITFDEDDVKREVDLWNRGGSERYLDSIHVADIIPASKFVISEIKK